METCKLQMAANRRALKSLQHFQEKCPHTSWVKLELDHLRNELVNLDDKISQTKFHVATAKWARLGDNLNSDFFAYYKVLGNRSLRMGTDKPTNRKPDQTDLEGIPPNPMKNRKHGLIYK